MKKGDYLSIILRSKKSVFSFKDIALLWKDSGNSARVRINYYIKNNDLYRIRQGLYAKDKNYDRFELATRIFTPAYISFETVLGQNGLIFQYYSQIFVASYLTREIKIDGQIYFFRKLKDTILTDKTGIEDKGEYLTAGKERAFMDMIYLNKNYYFDNLRSINWQKCFDMLQVYQQKTMARALNSYYKRYKDA